MSEPALLAADAAFSGVLAFDGAARVDGRLEGRVVARGRLEVGPSAEIRGDVHVDVLVLAGRVEGDVVARERAELAPSARLVGSLRAERLVLADGARLEGRCATGPASPEDRRATGPASPEDRPGARGSG